VDITAVVDSIGAATLGEDILVELPVDMARQTAEHVPADMVNPMVEDARAVEVDIKVAAADMQVVAVDTPAVEVDIKAGAVTGVEAITDIAIPARS
jgi:hypothetical protein